jgi:hypothetical protein
MPAHADLSSKRAQGATFFVQVQHVERQNVESEIETLDIIKIYLHMYTGCPLL